jgi:surfeit locus 1 family protein
MIAGDPPPALPSVGATRPAARGALAFRPRLAPTLLLVALLALFLPLADWQWQKAERKAALQALADARRHAAAISLPAEPITDAEAWRYRRVRLVGEFVAGNQILLDNQVRHGQVGVSVLTPIRLSSDPPLHVLVDRGWLPLPPGRRDLPAPPVPAGTVELTGVAVPPPARVFQLAADTAAPGGNALWQTVDLGRYRSSSGLVLQPLVVRLDPEAEHGFAREWPRADERHERHRSYALQWLGFALAAIGIWVWYSLRRRAEDA